MLMTSTSSTSYFTALPLTSLGPSPSPTGSSKEAGKDSTAAARGFFQSTLRPDLCAFGQPCIPGRQVSHGAIIGHYFKLFQSCRHLRGQCRQGAFSSSSHCCGEEALTADRECEEKPWSAFGPFDDGRAQGESSPSGERKSLSLQLSLTAPSSVPWNLTESFKEVSCLFCWLNAKH